MSIVERKLADESSVEAMEVCELIMTNRPIWAASTVGFNVALMTKPAAISQFLKLWLRGVFPLWWWSFMN